MDLTTVVQKAEKLGINTKSLGKFKKADLIRMIQRAEGNTDCYASKTEGCPHIMCCFMIDCYAEAKANQKKPAAATKKSRK